MLPYIVRRLLLMIPTLLGIALVVFLLLALSPGGIGAGVTGGVPVVGGKRAWQQAYYEERYGFKDPVLVQYGRWLAHIAPIKFGARELITPSGEHLAPPRDVDPPPLPSWFPLSSAARSALDDVARGPGDVAGAVNVDSQREYRRTEAASIGARAAYRTQRRALGDELIEYAAQQGIAGVRTARGDCRFEVLEPLTPQRDAKNWSTISALAASLDDAYVRALHAQAALDKAFAERPFPEVGMSLVPGMVSIASPDFGVSLKGRAASALIGEALPVTLGLNVIAFALMYLIAVPTGILSASRRGSWFDVASGGFFLALWSIPAVWAGTIAIGYLANKQYLHWFPVAGLHDANSESWTFLPSVRGDGSFERGFLLDTLWHMCLPVACLVYGGFAILAKQTRAAMLDNFSADYVRTARAKGLDRATVTMRHVFRNSLLPIITMFVTVFPLTLAGSIVVERIFTVPGMGLLLLEAIHNGDRELILANTFMIACVNLVALLVGDALYAAVDPRVRYD